MSAIVPFPTAVFSSKTCKRLFIVQHVVRLKQLKWSAGMFGRLSWPTCLRHMVPLPSLMPLNMAESERASEWSGDVHDPLLTCSLMDWPVLALPGQVCCSCCALGIRVRDQGHDCDAHRFLGYPCGLVFLTCCEGRDDPAHVNLTRKQMPRATSVPRQGTHVCIPDSVSTLCHMLRSHDRNIARKTADGSS